MEATQLSNTEGSLGSPSASSAPSRLIMVRVRGDMFTDWAVNNTGSSASSRVPNGLVCNLELEMRVDGLETSLQNVTADVAGVKQDVAGVKQDVSDMR
ncbi:hypothetical protein F2Q68_00045686 [Brassica cretica]|nr:hypothetical protein F2Q68_00045686 [Brassica cretica]